MVYKINANNDMECNRKGFNMWDFERGFLECT